MMKLPPLTTLDVPLRMDESGTIRVSGTRVILDLVIGAFQNGATPEEIVDRYDTLKLSDVYAVVAHYLAHKDELDTYLDQRRTAAAQLRRDIESQPGYAEHRAAMQVRLAEAQAAKRKSSDSSE